MARVRLRVNGNPQFEVNIDMQDFGLCQRSISA